MCWLSLITFFLLFFFCFSIMSIYIYEDIWQNMWFIFRSDYVHILIFCCVYLYVLIALLAFSMNVKGITLILNCRFITLSSSQVGLTLMNRYWLWRKSYWPSWTGLWLCQYLWFSYFVLSRHQSQIRRCVCVFNTYVTIIMLWAMNYTIAKPVLILRKCLCAVLKRKCRFLI